MFHTLPMGRVRVWDDTDRCDGGRVRVRDDADGFDGRDGSDGG